MTEPMDAGRLAFLRDTTLTPWEQELVDEVDRLRAERDEWRDRWEAASTFMGPGFRARAALNRVTDDGMAFAIDQAVTAHRMGKREGNSIGQTIHELIRRLASGLD